MTTKSAQLPAEAVTLVEALECHGFATGWFAASVLVAPLYGLSAGADTVVDSMEDEAPADARTMVDRIGAWVSSHRDERFFAYVHLIDPQYYNLPPPEHVPPPGLPEQGADETVTFLRAVYRGEVTPTEPQQAWLRQLYDDRVRYLDAQLERLLEVLAQEAPNTLFVLTGSHSEWLGEGGRFGHEGDDARLQQVPLVMVGPGRPGPRQGPIDHAQVAPTILDALGFELPRRFEAAPIGTPALTTVRSYTYSEASPALEGEACTRLRELGYLAPDHDCAPREPSTTGDDGPCVTGRGG